MSAGFCRFRFVAAAAAAAFVVGLAAEVCAFTPAAHRAFPQVPAHHYTPMPLRVVAIAAAESAHLTSIQAFVPQLLSGTWFGAMSTEYGLGAASTQTQVWTLPASQWEAAVTSPKPDKKLVKWLGSIVATHALPALASTRTIYLLYLTENLRNVFSKPDSKGKVAGGWTCGTGNHFVKLDSTTPPFQTGDAIGLVIDCDSANLDSLTMTSTHETIESTSDVGGGYALYAPDASQPWTTSPWAVHGGKNYIEIGDICGGNRSRLGGSYEMERIYGDQAAAAGGDPCVPASPLPYYNVSTPEDWYPVDVWLSPSTKPKEYLPAKQVSIVATGWSAQLVDDWSLAIGSQYCSPGAQGWSATLDQTTINNGKTATLSVSVQHPASPGFCVYRLDSHRASDSADEDSRHSWTVGVYVKVLQGLVK